jgi:F-type H+-transporting ATPase subunit delta
MVAADRLLGGAPDQAAAVSAELFALLDALDRTPELVRALANPNRDAKAKAALVASVLDGAGPIAKEIAQTLAVQRWSRDEDLALATEQLAYDAALAHAAHAGMLKRVENELFQVDLLLTGDRDLRSALDDPVASPEAKADLLEQVFKKAVLEDTYQLLVRVVQVPRGRTVIRSLIMLGDHVAARRRRLVANVVSASPLSKAQLATVERYLKAEYGREMQLNVTTDPELVGGLRVRVGDDLIDASLRARFTSVRRALTG